MKSLKTSLYTLTAAIVICSLYVLAGPLPAASANQAELDIALFNPGRIIDNHIFTDSSTMTVEEIQRFLETNVDGGECARYRENTYSGLNTGPYTCLFEFQENIETGEHNYGLFDDFGAPAQIENGISAAEIIWRASQDHQINPQTLLVLLQKEQSLITDSWPWLGQFARATGYHCPDTAACNPALADFHKQVNGAAWQFRRYLEHIDEYWYVVGDNYILYNPNVNCGSQIVNIENTATIALYLYTPYVPNQAALNNYLGHGDNCSAYGNRNFWVYFNRWFGPTIEGENPVVVEDDEVEDNEQKTWSFDLSFQGVYTDSTKSVALDGVSNILGPNQTAYIVLIFENTGTGVWEKNSEDKQIALVSTRSDETSPLCHSSWLNTCQQIALMQEDVVGPGQFATFEFEVLTPDVNGKISESLTLINNEQTLSGQTADIIFNVTGSRNLAVNQPAPAAPAPIVEENTPVVATNTVVLPGDWHNLSVIEKIRLNPWGCHNTTQIRADNGRCLSGGYTIPNNLAVNQPAPAAPAPIVEENTPVVATNTVVLPGDWHNLSVIEKIRLNPWGCHNTTQIRADNGRCLSGGYTIPNNLAVNQPAPAAPAPIVEENTPVVATNTVVLPGDWHNLSVIEKIRLNPWGCHNTTQIRADNGRCLSGGYTIPNSLV